MPNGKRMDVDPNGHMVTPVGDFWAQFLMEDYYYKGFLFGEGGGDLMYLAVGMSGSRVTFSVSGKSL